MNYVTITKGSMKGQTFAVESTKKEEIGSGLLYKLCDRTGATVYNGEFTYFPESFVSPSLGVETTRFNMTKETGGSPLGIGKSLYFKACLENYDSFKNQGAIPETDRQYERGYKFGLGLMLTQTLGLSETDLNEINDAAVSFWNSKK